MDMMSLVFFLLVALIIATIVAYEKNKKVKRSNEIISGFASKNAELLKQNREVVADIGRAKNIVVELQKENQKLKESLEQTKEEPNNTDNTAQTESSSRPPQDKPSKNTRKKRGS